MAVSLIVIGNDTTGSGSITLAGVTAGATIICIPNDGNNVAAPGFTVSSNLSGSFTARGSVFGAGSGTTSFQCFELNNAAAGTHTLTIMAGGAGAGYFGAVAAAYTASVIDNSHAAIAGAVNGGPVTGTNAFTVGPLTPTTNGCHLVAWYLNGSSGNAFTTGTSPNTWANESNTAWQGFAVLTEGFDQTAAASITSTAGNTASIGYVGMLIALAPAQTAVAVGASINPRGPGISPDRQAQFQAKRLSTAQSTPTAISGFSVTLSVASGNLANAPYGAVRTSGPGVSPDYTKLFRPKALDSSQQGTSPLTGNAVALSVGTGSLSGSGSLTGNAISLSIAQGLVAQLASGALNGGVVSLSVGTGLLSGAGALTGNAVSLSVGQAQMTAVIAGNGLSISVDTGSLTGSGLLTGNAVILSPATGLLQGAGSLSGLTVSVSVGTGDLEPFNPGSITGFGLSLSVGQGPLSSTFTPPAQTTGSNAPTAGGGGGGKLEFSRRPKLSTEKREEREVRQKLKAVEHIELKKLSASLAEVQIVAKPSDLDDDDDEAISILLS